MSDAASKIMKKLFEHAEYLDSIADLITFTYQKDSDLDCFNILLIVGKSEEYFTKIKTNQEYDFNSAIRNLRNAWYHEVAFIQDNSSRQEKMKFTVWKIIQFYYGIYCALSSIVRCEIIEEMGHIKMINYFTNNMLNRRELSGFFPQPFCFIMAPDGKIKPEFAKKISWTHGLQIKCPSVEKCLTQISDGKTVSIFHYFLDLRNWVNYEDSYIFRRFYSTSVKPNMYFNMLTILSTFVSIAEIFLMYTLNYQTIHDEAELFINDFDQFMEPTTPPEERVTSVIKTRFSYYENNKEWFFA